MNRHRVGRWALLGVSGLLLAGTMLAGCGGISISGTGANNTKDAKESAQVAKKPHMVNVNKSFTDKAVGSSGTIKQAGTAWIAALPQGSPIKSAGTGYIRMVGLTMSADSTNSKYMNSGVYPSGFKLVAQDGKTEAFCFAPNPSYAKETQAIIRAVSGGKSKAVDMNRNGNKTDGWFYCMTDESNDKAFNEPGYTIRYHRNEGRVSGQVKPVPPFTWEVKVKP
jgi:hypothetical protein